VHAELRRPGVTQALLWSEYRERNPKGFGYTWFTESYHAYVGKLDLVMRQDHHAGEKVFLDFAGDTIPIVDPETGVIRRAQLFVAVLGASSYTYAEALPSQELIHWCAAHVRAFEFFGGVPAILVPDNLHSAVDRPHRYEPDLNRSYSDLAAHYGSAIIPARSRKPRDKARVEVGVQVAQRWILAALRNRTFFSLAEANAAIRERLEWLNARPFRKLEGTRRSVFESIDRPALNRFPLDPTSSEPGSGPKSASTTTSRSTATTTASHTGLSASGPRFGSARAPSRSSFVAAGWRAMLAAPQSVVTARSRLTCRRAIGPIESGLRAASWPGASRPDPRPVPLSRPSSRAGRIPSRASARVWGSCVWAIAMERRAWKPPASGLSRLVPSDTAASTRS
jgi:transposase